MRLSPKFLLLLALAGPAAAQTAPSPSPARPTPPPPTPRPPTTTDAWVVTVELRALAPEMKTQRTSAPEAQALIQELRGTAQLVSRFYLAQDISRQEILSTDFILPSGALLLHKAGDRFYVIADPAAKTYLIMDSEQLLTALEGGAGILNSEYKATVRHTTEWRTIAGTRCRKSIVTVTYVSSIPFENDRVLVNQKNDIEVWHTSEIVSGVAMDHLFFKFQRDKTGTVQKILNAELGFPMEVKLVATQGSGAGKGASSAQPGSLQMVVSEARKEKKLDVEMFRIPPAGYRRIEKNPYFKDGGLSGAGARMSKEQPRP